MICSLVIFSDLLCDDSLARCGLTFVLLPLPNSRLVMDSRKMGTRKDKTCRSTVLFSLA